MTDGSESGRREAGQGRSVYSGRAAVARPVDATVDSLIDGTKLGDVAARKALMDGGEAAIAASTDPMIVAARRVDPIVRGNAT